MPSCRITFGTAEPVEVEGDLQAVIDVLHEVFSRRQGTFAVLRDTAGDPIAVRPDAVVHVRPVQADGG